MSRKRKLTDEELRAADDIQAEIERAYRESRQDECITRGEIVEVLRRIATELPASGHLLRRLAGELE